MSGIFPRSAFLSFFLAAAAFSSSAEAETKASKS